jgi:acetyl esterase/lipase
MTQLKYFKIIYFFVLITYLSFNYFYFHRWFNPSNAQDTHVQGISNEPFIIDGGEKVEEGVKRLKNLKYVNDSEDSKKLDLYYPSEVLKEQKYPLIIYIHGGAWLEGDKSYFKDFELVRNGYIVASIDYRLSTEDLFPAQIHDTKASLRWLRKNSAKYNIDSENVGVYGESAGAHLAALMGTTHDNKELNGNIGLNLDEKVDVKAVVSEYGLPNLKTIAQQCKDNPLCKSNYYSPDSIISKLLDCTYTKCGQKLEFASPANYISSNDASFLNIHGSKDDIVPEQQTIEFHKSLTKANLYSEITIEKDAKHIDSKYRKEYFPQIINFFDLKLKNFKYPFCEYNVLEKVIFEDVTKDSENFEAINNLACNQAFYNIADKKFEPDKKITRGEISVILNIIFQIENNSECEPFDDVQTNDKNFTFIQNLKCAGITKGFSNNEFKPNEEINATQLASLIAKTKKIELNTIKSEIKKLNNIESETPLSRAQAAQIVNQLI